VATRFWENLCTQHYTIVVIILTTFCNIKKLCVLLEDYIYESCVVMNIKLIIAINNIIRRVLKM